MRRRSPIIGAPFRTALAAILAAALSVVSVMSVAAVAPAGAQDRDGDGKIQILGLTRLPDGQIELELAIPPSIDDLAPIESNFGVTDGGRLTDFVVQPLTTALDVVIVLDTSGSMKGPALAAAKRAAAAFIQELPSEAGVGLVSFGETAVVHRRPGADRSDTLADLAGLEAAGETALWDGLVVAGGLIDAADNDRPYVVVLSDGEDTVSTATRQDAVDRLIEASAGLYSVAIESPDTDLEVLRETVAEVGGQFFATADIGELDSLYLDMAGRLSSRYRLRFVSYGEAERTIVVSVATGGAIATARTIVDEGVIGPRVSEPGPEQVLNIPADATLGAVAAPEPGVLGGALVLWVGLGAMFLALAVLALLMIAPANRVRLSPTVGADRVSGFNGRLSLAADRFIARRDGAGELDKALDAAGISLRPGEFVVVSTLIVVLLSMGASLLGGMVLGVVVAMLATVATLAYLSVRAGRRRAKFADQLTDTLSIVTGGLRAGRGLPQAIELVSTEAPSPTAEQFQRIVFEARVGRDMTESMMAVAERMKNQDLEWVTRAVDINRELGGDLTEMLDNVADTIRDRRRVARQVQSLSAEGRASGWVLLALPVVMFLFVWWRTPENAALMFNQPLGRMLLAGGVFGMAVGYFWIQKLVDLKY